VLFHSQPSKQKRKFSSFFKSLVIELDKELYGPDNHLVEVRMVLEPGRDKLPGDTEQTISVLVECCNLSASDELCCSLARQWHRMPTTQETDGFQVKRPGDLNVKCTLLLMLDHQVTVV
jgi:SWI/SNF-related matrix-associated actin-dependent regulator of chromatin subfamily D